MTTSTTGGRPRDRASRPVIERATVQRFLDQDPIAVVGVSRDERSFANGVFRRLRATGTTCIPVHREAATIDGVAAVASVDDLDPDVRALLVMLPAPAAAEVVDRFVRRVTGTAGTGTTGTGTTPTGAGTTPIVWLHRGAGPGAVSDAAIESCAAAGVDVVAGACPLMFLEPVRGIHRLHRRLAARRFTS